MGVTHIVATSQEAMQTPALDAFYKKYVRKIHTEGVISLYAVLYS